MEKQILSNGYTGEHIGDINGNIVRTLIGTYRVGDSDIHWLTSEAVKRRNFSAMDVRAVGFLIHEDEDEKGERYSIFESNGQPIKVYVPSKDEDE